MIKGFSITSVLATSGITLTPTSIWNSAGTTFVGVLLNITDTASAAGSLLMDLRIGGASKFSVDKNGRLLGAFGGASFGQVDSATWALGSASANNVAIKTSGFRVADTGTFAFSSNSNANSTLDLYLYRDAADTLAQRRGTNAQTSRVYGTFTDASNYRRVAIGMTTGGVASIAPEGAGTGASGNVLHISGLPTANPGPGILWNNGGTVEVGT